jgi:hypothetical protein
MSKNLHLIPKMPLTKGQKFDAGMGCLTLSAPELFTVDITKRDGLHEGAPEKLDPFKRLTQEEVFAMPDIDDRKVYVKDHNERDKKEAEYNKERDAFNKKLHEELATLSWCWETVQNGMTGKAMEHNVDFEKGLPKDGEKQINFPKILVGGGLAWLEVFTQNDPATGKVPNGLFVRANGIPEIVRVAWTDLDCKPIKEKVKFGSKVLLNIYTNNLYGQDLEIGLWDKDTADPDDLLAISNKGNFTGEALIFKTLPNEVNKVGVSGGIQVKGKAESHVQKVKIPVLVDHKWMFSAGKELKIYPTVKSKETGKFLKVPKDSFLEVSVDGVLHETVIEATNNPLLMGKVETNVAAFHPCKYETIELKVIPETEKEINRTLFNAKEYAGKTHIAIPIICPDVDHMKEYSINLISLDTKECRYLGKQNDHKNNSLQVNKKPDNFIVTANDGKIINFKAGFNYHPKTDNLLEKSSFKILEYLWPINLPNDNNTPLIISANTCRYINTVDLLVYPDVKWTLDFRFGMKGPEQLTHTNLPIDRRNSNEDSKDPKSRYSDAQAKAIKAGKVNTYGMEKRANGMELEFQLVLKAEYNKGEELELAAKYAEKIKKLLNLFLSLKEGLDILTNIDKVNSAHQNTVKTLGAKLFKAPIIGSIDYPAISIGGKWQAAIKKDTDEIYTDGKLMLRFNPLLKGDVSLDIIAAASYIPAFGQAVKAIELALNTTGAELNFLLTIFGQVNVEFEYALAEKGGSNLNLNGELGLKLALSAKVKIDMSAIIFERNIGMKAEISAEGYVVTSIKPKASIGHDEKGSYVEAKCDFMGINIVCIVTATAEGKTVQYKDTFNVLDRKDDFVKGKSYIIEA